MLTIRNSGVKIKKSKGEIMADYFNAVERLEKFYGDIPEMEKALKILEEGLKQYPGRTL